MNPQQITIRTAFLSLISNSFLASIKALAGFFGHSHALIADAIESITDIFASILLLLGFKYAQRPPDQNHPYGHGRIEALMTFVVVVFLVISATLIAYESIQQIRNPHQLPEKWTLLVLAAIILWKEISFQIVLKKSILTQSTALRAEAWHHRSDAISSVAAFVGISIALFLGEGYEAADDWAALLASGFILYNSYLIFRPALGEIMDEQTHDELVADIRKIALEVEGILGTEKCFIRKAGLKYHVDLHAIVQAQISVREGHQLAHQLKATLLEKIPQLHNVLIHVEPNT